MPMSGVSNIETDMQISHKRKYPKISSKNVIVDNIMNITLKFERNISCQVALS